MSKCQTDYALQEPDVRHGKGNREGLAERGRCEGMWHRHMIQASNSSPTRTKPNARPRLQQPQFFPQLHVLPLGVHGQNFVCKLARLCMLLPTYLLLYSRRDRTASRASNWHDGTTLASCSGYAHPGRKWSDSYYATLSSKDKPAKSERTV